MNEIVYVGPSLDVTEVRETLPDAAIRGPVRCGDVLQAVHQGFSHILIIDGYFDHCPPVWHKEILWAIARERTVWGASSMGALRAAELDTFGMMGCGRIYEAYRDGLLEDDDEVAVSHLEEDKSFRSISEALVNIRVTLHAAVAQQLVTRDEATQYVALAKSRFYPERNYHNLLDDAKVQPALQPSATRLAQWLGQRFENKVDQKREDARELLATVRRVNETKTRPDPPPPISPFAFAHTEGFEELVRRIGVRREPT